MTDQVKASRLAKEGFELWRAKQPELAVPLYEEALKSADPAHWALADYHGEFAGVLASLNRHSEATVQHKLAISVQLAQVDGDNFDVGVIMERYFLAENYLQLNKPLLALEAIAPSLAHNTEGSWLLHLAKTRALHALGKASESYKEASLSIKRAPSKEKQEELINLFAKELGNKWLTKYSRGTPNGAP